MFDLKIKYVTVMVQAPVPNDGSRPRCSGSSLVILTQINKPIKIRKSVK